MFLPTPDSNLQVTQATGFKKKSRVRLSQANLHSKLHPYCRCLTEILDWGRCHGISKEVTEAAVHNC